MQKINSPPKIPSGAVIVFGQIPNSNSAQAGWFNADHAKAARIFAAANAMSVIDFEAISATTLAETLRQGQLKPGGGATLHDVPRDALTKLKNLLDAAKPPVRVPDTEAASAIAAPSPTKPESLSKDPAKQSVKEQITNDWSVPTWPLPNADAAARSGSTEVPKPAAQAAVTASTTPIQSASPPTAKGTATMAPLPPAPPPASPKTPELTPAHWDQIKVGATVLAADLDKANVADGWYEAIVIQINGPKLTLKWRDYPEEGRITRTREHIALLYPAL